MWADESISHYYKRQEMWKFLRKQDIKRGNDGEKSSCYNCKYYVPSKVYTGEMYCLLNECETYFHFYCEGWVYKGDD